VAVLSRFPFTARRSHTNEDFLLGGRRFRVSRGFAEVDVQKIDARLAANPELNPVVLGDFNDTCDSRPIRLLIGRGRHKLIDTRPAERNGDNLPSSNPAWPPRNVAWTHYLGKDDTHSRIDYILLSPGLKEKG
jgi:endonuclease/exonuclease/phosphatase family metal-dependent hydrolase